MKRSKVKIVEGVAKFRDGKTVVVESETGTQIIRAEAIVIATGSAPVALPALPFGGAVISSTEALALGEVPSRLVVVGAGYIGLELGTAFAKMGAEVAIVEAEPTILPQYDAELTRPVAKRLDALGVKTLVGAKAKGLTAKADALLVETSGHQEVRLAADRILVTVGRRPVVDGWGREELVLDMDGKFLRIDDAMPNLDARDLRDRRRDGRADAGASRDGAGRNGRRDRRGRRGEAGTNAAFRPSASPIPKSSRSACRPPRRAAPAPEIKVGLFPFTANGRAMTRLGEDGFVRVVARADNHLVLGVQAVGQDVSELSTAFGLALEMGARLEDVAETIHAHPDPGRGLSGGGAAGRSGKRCIFERIPCSVIARSAATKQSSSRVTAPLDCFAALAMTMSRDGENLDLVVAHHCEIADRLADERASDRGDIRNRSVPRIALVFADNAEGLPPTVVARERHSSSKGDRARRRRRRNDLGGLQTLGEIP